MECVIKNGLVTIDGVFVGALHALQKEIENNRRDLVDGHKIKAVMQHGEVRYIANWDIIIFKYFQEK